MVFNGFIIIVQAFVNKADIVITIGNGALVLHRLTDLQRLQVIFEGLREVSQVLLDDADIVVHVRNTFFVTQFFV